LGPFERDGKGGRTAAGNHVTAGERFGGREKSLKNAFARRFRTKTNYIVFSALKQRPSWQGALFHRGVETLYVAGMNR